MYFPKQTVPSELDPAAELKLTIKVSRTNPNDDITVPFVVKQEGDIFQFGSIAFNNGEQDTNLEVTFPGMEELNKEYSFSISIEDPAYANLYGTATTDFALTVSRVKWNDVVGTDPETGAPVTEGIWVDDFMTTWYGVDNVAMSVNVQEHSQTPGFYRVLSPYASLKYKYNDPGDWDESKPYYLYVHAEDPDFVWIPKAQTGMIWSYGMVSIWSEAGWNIENDGATLAEAKQLGHGGKLVKGVVSFAKSDLLCSMASLNGGGWYYGNSNGKFRLILPGGVETDYTWSVVQAGAPEKGELPVAFTLGADITAIRYKAYEGAITGEDLDSVLEEFKKATDLPEVTASGIINLSFEKTGVYTLLANAVDVDNVSHGTTSIILYYVADGDQAEVKAEAILQNISLADRAEGLSPENNLSFMVKGEDLVDAKVLIFKLVDLITDQDAAEAALMKAASADAKTLAKINGAGYVGNIAGLIPGTDFVLAFYASTGYASEIFYSDVVRTEGDPLPIYQDYDAESYADEFEPKSQDDVIGTWNYYAIEYFSNKSGLREYMGKVTIADSTAEDEGPDDAGYLDEYVTIKGLTGGSIKNYPDDTLEADLYGGNLYTPIAGKDATGVNVYSMIPEGSAFNQTYYTAFIPVREGYMAFVSYSSSRNYTGLAWYSGGFLCWVRDMLLVKPEFDDNGVAPSNLEIDYAISRHLEIIEGNWKGDKSGRVPGFRPAKKTIEPMGVFVENDNIHLAVKSAKVVSARFEEKKAVSGKPSFKAGELRAF